MECGALFDLFNLDSAVKEDENGVYAQKHNGLLTGILNFSEAQRWHRQGEHRRFKSRSDLKPR